MAILADFFGSWACVGAGLLFVSMGVPLFLRKVPRNSFYGFRLSYTMKDDEIWFAVNEALGRQQLFQGGLLVAAGLGSFLLGSARPVQMGFLVGCALFLTIGVIYSLVRGLLLMNEMARSRGLRG